jgi:anti-anti-sigma factor
MNLVFQMNNTKISFTLQRTANNKLHCKVMNVKIDTKERFTVITPEVVHLSVNMTEELSHLLLGYLQKDIPHIVFNMHTVQSVDELMGENLALIQQQFYEKNVSFVICCLQPAVEKMLDKKELLEIMNITPSESEAWDIVQMEEIERELLGDE